MSLFVPGVASATDGNNNPLQGAVWRFYSVGTTTPENLASGLPQSADSDASGDFSSITLTNDVTYRAVLEDPDGRVLVDIPNQNKLFSAFVAAAAQVSGQVAPGATWSFYTTTTTTAQPVYADPELATPLGAVVTGDAEGNFPPIYLDDAVTYKAVLADADGTTITTLDPVTQATEVSYLDPDAVTSPTTTYGALSRSTEGAGIPVTGTSISSGDGSGHWTISNSRLYPSAQGVTDSLNAGPYTLVLDDGYTWNITAVANAYEATDASEFDALIALGAATMSGKTLRVRGEDMLPSDVTGHDYTTQGAPLRIETVETGSIQYLPIRTVDGIDFAAKFQMRGWPANYGECVRFKTGTQDNLRFLAGTSFRHGYGASQVDYDTDFDYDEYTRVDNVQTATTTTATYALSWQDATATDGWIEFFNRGSETVHAVVGGSGVTATTGDPSIAPGAKLRIANLDPTTDTHIAIIAAANTSEINARAEIGLHYYASQAFAFDGGVTVGKLHFIGCTFQDLKNGAKSSADAADFAIMDCTFERIYGDICTTGVASGGKVRFVRNLTTVPFARSGIAENLDGDARDPHGDDFQMFGSGTHSFGDIIIAGNRMIVPDLRSGVDHQGAFLSDNDITLSYDGLWIINNIGLGGNVRSVSIGEASGPYEVGDFMLYGQTSVPHDGLSNGNKPQVLMTTGTSTHAYVGSTIAYGFQTEAGDDYPLDDDVLAYGVVSDKAALFPNFADLATAANRTEIDAALTGAAEAAGIGAAATTSAIDWSTTDPDAVVLWANVPSGAAWNDLIGQTPSAVIETGLSKILNRNTGLAVSPGTGVEWRSVDTDGVTEVQAWTTGSGTIDADQFVQIRKTASASDFTAVTANITINGFTEGLDITTGKADPTAWLINGATAGYFVDTANVPSSTNVITWKGRFYFPTSVPSNKDVFTQESNGFTGNLLSSGLIRGTVKDGTGTIVMSAVTILASGSITADTWHDVEIEVDQTNSQVTVTLDGVATVTAFTTTGNGVFLSTRELSMLGTTAGGNTLPNGALIADLEIELDGVSHKTISNDATVANADGWHNGGSFTQGGTP